MRARLMGGLAAVAALALAAPAAAAGTSGPFAGTVTQGQVAVHEYDNNPRNNICLQYVVGYQVTIAHAPATDRLTLAVGSLSVTTTGGAGVISFLAGVCTHFDIKVTGTAVADEAAYVVTVTRDTGVGRLGDITGPEIG